MNPIRGYYRNGGLWYEEWSIFGKLHRVDGPALQTWHDNGQLECKHWRIRNKLHRLDGPAFQQWDKSGELAEPSWWIEGIPVEPIEDPLAWALFIAKNFGNVHGLEKFCLDNIGEKAARAILASTRII